MNPAHFTITATELVAANDAAAFTRQVRALVAEGDDFAAWAGEMSGVGGRMAG